MDHIKITRVFELTEPSLLTGSPAATEEEKLHIQDCEECRDVLQAARRPFWRRIVVVKPQLLDRNFCEVDAASRRPLPLLRDTILRCA
jgi:hypothetical protein